MRIETHRGFGVRSHAGRTGLWNWYIELDLHYLQDYQQLNTNYTTNIVLNKEPYNNICLSSYLTIISKKCVHVFNMII